MRAMVLGASGYLGRKMIQNLQAAGHDITGVYRKTPVGMKNSGIRAEIPEIQGELLQKKYDWIINCAAVYESKDVLLHDVVDANMIYALQVLNCAVECGVEKFLTVDTCLPQDFNLYSFTKKKFAEFGKFYAGKHGITFINILLEMFYGEDEPEGRFLVRCCRNMLKGEELMLTAGTQKRDIIYIDDVCDAIMSILESSFSGFCNVPVGSGEAVSLRTILEYMCQITGSKSILRFGAIPTRENEPDCVADLSILNQVGYQPKYTWRKGIERLCHQIRERECRERCGN